MLEELDNVKQFKDEPFRRWFMDDRFDLIVWFKPDEQICGFQLCYDKHREEKAFTWTEDSGFSHNRIDDGEAHWGDSRTPILIPDGTFSGPEVLNQFQEQSEQIDRKVVSFIEAKILEHENLK